MVRRLFTMHSQYKAGLVLAAFLIGLLMPIVGRCALDSADRLKPATSVEEANSTFADRAAYAVLQFAARNNDGVTDYVQVILARLAYLQYFPTDTEVGMQKRKEAWDSLLIHHVKGQVGTTVDSDTFKDPIFGQTLGGYASREGDYDQSLIGYILMLYHFDDTYLRPDVRDHIINELLVLKGPFDDGYLHFPLIVSSVAGSLIISVPETENHIMMIYSSWYLANQLFLDRTHDPAYDNSRNGMNVWMLSHLREFLQRDLIEYNARPYQFLTVPALLNLASFARDSKVRESARMVLDYIFAKMAISSNGARRAAPYRRKVNNYCPDLLGVRPCPSEWGETGIDDLTPFAMMLSGATDMLPSYDTFGGRVRTVPGSYPNDFLWVGLHAYRLPGLVHDLFIHQANRSFYQTIRHAGAERYSGSPSFLISAGGVATDPAYTIDLPVVGPKGKDDDRGIILPTTLMPTGYGESITDLIRFESYWTLSKDFAYTDAPLGRFCFPEENMGVAPNFACGLLPVIPDSYPRSGTCWRHEATPNGEWDFFNRSGTCSSNAPYGYYVAVFRSSAFNNSVERTCDYHGLTYPYDDIPTILSYSFGLFEVLDTFVNPTATFDGFVAGVLARNGGRQFFVNTRNEYKTTSGLEVQFVCHPSPMIVHMQQGGVVLPTDYSTSGTIINGDGQGMVTIDNPVLGKRLRLDMVNPLNPRRLQEMRGGPEVWVDLSVGQTPGNGTYASPFNTLDEGVKAVPIGGIVKVLPGSMGGPFPYNKPLTLDAPGGAVTIGQ